MADATLLDLVHLPPDTFRAIAWQPLHSALAPVHFLVRITHVISMGAFFGGIGLLDLRLVGWRGTVPLRAFAQQILPWIWVTFAIAIGTGCLLFAYDPVRVGARAFFVPKMIAVSIGLLNAAWFHRAVEPVALGADITPPVTARLAGFVSLACWTSAIVCASLNVEAMPAELFH